MPQIHLPIFPEGATEINSHLAFESRHGKVAYFYGNHPVFTHAKDDLQTFRMITSQFIVNGSARVCEIIQAFGLPPATVKRYVALYREKGAAGFYQPRAHRGATVLTTAVLEQAQLLLDEGKSRREVAELLDVKPNTIAKAILGGRLHESKKKG